MRPARTATLASLPQWIHCASTPGGGGPLGLCRHSHGQENAVSVLASPTLHAPRFYARHPWPELTRRNLFGQRTRHAPCRGMAPPCNGCVRGFCGPRAGAGQPRPAASRARVLVGALPSHTRLVSGAIPIGHCLAARPSFVSATHVRRARGVWLSICHPPRTCHPHPPRRFCRRCRPRDQRPATTHVGSWHSTLHWLAGRVAAPYRALQHAAGAVRTSDTHHRRRCRAHG